MDGAWSAEEKRFGTERVEYTSTTTCVTEREKEMTKLIDR